MKISLVLATIFLATSLATCNGMSTGGASLQLLEHLDDFNLLSIFDMLGLPDLLNIGVLNPRFSYLIGHHYLIPKYHLNEREFLVKIDENTILRFDNDDDDDFAPLADGYNRTIGLLQAFGHLFERIKIHVNSNGYIHLKEVSRIINEYCPGAVVEVTLLRGNQINDDSQFALKAATIVNLRQMFATGFIETLQLNTAFPHMRQLNVDVGSNLSYLHQHFPHLTDLKLQSSYDIDDESNLRGLFRLNRQLRSVQMPLFFNSAYLSYINEILPNLESLSLRNLNTQNYENNLAIHDSVRFKNVKHFTLSLFTHNCQWNVGIRRRLESIQFESLDTFTVTSNVLDSVDFLIGLIVQNRGLKKVSIASNELTLGQLTQLSEQLSELKEISIEWNRPDTLDVLNRFLARAVNSKIGHVNVDISDDGDLRVDDVLEAIPEGWQHRETTPEEGSYTLRFERPE